MIDLTGGQPDLTPEWVVWMMDELESRGLQDRVYLWSDDNLSTDYLWQVLSETERAQMGAYPLYSRVCCFKGFDTNSFIFNTSAEPERFDNQFSFMARLLTLGIDLYAYVTFTTPATEGISEAMARFVERLQELDEYLPLRTVPLQILPFTPVTRRLKPATEVALVNQYRVLDAWKAEIERRFTGEIRALPITDILLGGRRTKHEPSSNTL
jgi:hypothetical protein